MTEPISDEQLSALEELEKKATPGQWEYSMFHGTFEMTSPQYLGGFGMHPRNVFKSCVDDWQPNTADAELIVAMRNNLRTLLADFRELRAENRRLMTTRRLNDVIAERGMEMEQMLTVRGEGYCLFACPLCTWYEWIVGSATRRATAKLLESHLAEHHLSTEEYQSLTEFGPLVYTWRVETRPTLPPDRAERAVRLVNGETS